MARSTSKKTTKNRTKFIPLSAWRSPLRVANFVLLFSVIGVLFLYFGKAAVVAGFYGSVEQDQVNRINARRATIGRPGLQHIECLNALAENHTKEMADKGYIYHTSNSGLANGVQYACGGYWSIIGENVGVGPDSASIWNAFMASTAHRVNIEESRFTKVGVGAYYKSDGQVYITQLYANCSSCTSAWTTNASLPTDPVTPTVAPTANWSGWENLGGVLYAGSAPAATSWAPGRLDIFVRATDNTVRQKWYDGTKWNGFDNLGGAIDSSPAAVSWGKNRIDVFAKSKNNTLMHKWYNGSWSGWEDLGGSITSAPSAASWAVGRLDVFARGADGTLQHKWYDGRWSKWESLGGQILDAPTAVSWDTSRIDVFARGTDNAVKQKFFNGRWNGWVDMGGVVNAAPTVASWAPGRLDVFARGTNNGLYQRYYNGSWSGWNYIDAMSITSAPSAVSWDTNRIDVFARGTNGELLHKWFGK